MSANRRWFSGMLATEDWWAVWIGLALFAASLASLAGVDLVGWMVRPRPWEWTDLTDAFAWSKLFSPAGTRYSGWHALAAFAMTYAVFTALFALGARFLRLDVGRFVKGFTVLFAVTWLAWIAGNELHLTMVDATVDGRNRYQEAALSWGLQLGEGAPCGRDVFIERMFERGIGMSVHYIPLHLQPYWRDRYELKPDMFPVSQRVFERTATLPLYTRMTDGDVDRVVRAIKDSLR